MRIQRFNPTTRSGFTLLEVSAAMFALIVAMVFGGALLLAAMRADRVGAGTLLRLSSRADLADQFRSDVALANSTPDRLGNLTRGAACLILRLANGDHVIYQWQNGELTRTVQAGDREQRWLVSVPAQDLTIEFERPDGDRPVISLRLIEAPAHGTVRRAEVSAALGGDSR